MHPHQSKVAASKFYPRPTNMNLLQVILVAMFAVCLRGANACGSHPWYHEAPQSLVANLYSYPVDSNLYRLVGDEHISTAIELLSRKAFVQVSPRLAESLTGRPSNQWQTSNLYLLRGLRFPSKNSGVSLYAHSGDVLVHFGYLGEPGGEAGPAPVVANLKVLPRSLYTLCTGVM